MRIEVEYPGGLEAAKEKAVEQVEAKAAELMERVIPLRKRDLYREKAQEAREFLFTGEVGGYLQAETEARGRTEQQVAQAIMEKAQQARQRCAQIEKRRMQALDAIDAAETPYDALAVLRDLGL